MRDQTMAGFTTRERNYIRGELDRFFSTLPSVAEGFRLKTWRSGPQVGQPKLSAAAKGLVERGLIRLDTEPTATAILHGSWPGCIARD